MWQFVIGGWFFPFQSSCNAFIVKGEKVLEKCQNQGGCILLGPLHPWRWKHYNPLQCWNCTPSSTASHPLVLYSCACWLPESSYSMVLQMEELFVMVTKLPTAVSWSCSKQFVPLQGMCSHARLTSEAHLSYVASKLKISEWLNLL